MLGKIHRAFIWGSNTFAAVGITAMMLLVVSDIIARRTPSGNIIGADELVEQMMAIVVFPALAATQFSRGHIRIDAVTLKFSPRIRVGFEILAWVAGFGLLSMICWRLGIFAWAGFQTKSVTLGQGSFVTYPFTFLGTFGCGLLALQYLVDAIQSLIRVARWKQADTVRVAEQKQTEAS